MSINKKSPSFIQSAIALFITAAILSTGVFMGINISALLILNLVILSWYSIINGFSSDTIGDAIIYGIKRSVPAVIILMSMGVLISTWIMSGTVPMIVYYGLSVITPSLIVPMTFLLCAAISILTGSSWGTAGTIGVACIAMGDSMGLSLPLLAGAAISGVVLGDKLSPISDSTILTASMNEINLYHHVRSMAYTSLPAIIVSFVVFLILGYSHASLSKPATTIDLVQKTLAEQFHFNIILLLPILSIIVMSIKKMPALITILTSAIIAALLALFVQEIQFNDILNAFYNGYISDTGVQTVDTMLTKGGITSMFSVTSVSILALGIGGILDKTEYLRTVVDTFAHKITSARKLVFANLIIGILIVMLIPNFYVSNLPNRFYFSVSLRQKWHSPLRIITYNRNCQYNYSASDPLECKLCLLYKFIRAYRYVLCSLYSFCICRHHCFFNIYCE